MLIQIQDLTFGYDGSYDLVFDRVSVQIDSDWRLGFVGRNGRGKTTLLRLLMGELEYTGQIIAPMPFDYFPFPVEDTERETLPLLGSFIGETPQWQLIRELSLLEVSEDALTRPFVSLSQGERTKALLAALFCRENSFLLIDEPTNHLDLEGRAAVSSYLRQKSGFILVSHDRAFLDGCIDHVLSINRTGLEVQRGNFSTWQKNKNEQEAFEHAENKRLKQDIERLQDSARQAASFSDPKERTKGERVAGIKPDRGAAGAQAARLMKRSLNVERRKRMAADEKSRLLKDVETAAPLKLHPLTHHAPKIAEVRDLLICYDGQTVCQPVSFALQRGECLALAGKNGAGKSSILKLIQGEKIPHQGEIILASGLTISYVPQDASFLSGSLDDYIADSGVDESLCKAILRKLDFSPIQFEKDMGDYSAGQKKKVLLARSLCQQAHLYLWDEPLNYVDVLSRVQIETLLKEYRATMLIVEHDRAFLEAVGARTVAVHPDGTH